MQLPQLYRIRWAVRATLVLGVAASVIANVLHARDNPISQAIAAWPPLALLLTVELTSRIPMHKWTLAACRVLSTVAIAGIAAWVSYWHMQDVAAKYGETEISSYLLPISVDGLIVVASVSLVELAGRIRQIETSRNGELAEASPAPASPTMPTSAPAPSTPVAAPVSAMPVSAMPVSAMPVTSVPTGQGQISPALAARLNQPAGAGYIPQPRPAARPTTATSTPSAAPVSPGVGPLTQPHPVSPAVAATTRPVPAYANGSTPARPGVTRAAVSTMPRKVVTASAVSDSDEAAVPRQRRVVRPVQETAELADAIEAMHPEISETELARQLGITPTRLRAVRKEARELQRVAKS